MKVSVLVPVFNGERYLAECLDSILAQDFRDFEILISDNCSTDGSLEIIKSYAARDARIRWWQNPRNLGLTPNSNVCLKEARGEYIKFVHADDKLLSPLAIQKLVAALDAHPKASLAGSQQHFTGDDSCPAIFCESSGYFNGRRAIMTCLEHNTNFIGHPTLTIFRRHQGQRGFDERFTNFMDFEMWFHLLEQGDYIFLAEPLATWRIHSEQVAEIVRKGNSIYDHEALLLLEIYYQKSWFQAAVTLRMVFTQSRFLEKKYGPQAADLVRKMQSAITLRAFLAFWLDRKFEKIKTWPDRKIKKIKRWIDKTKNRFRQPAA